MKSKQSTNPPKNFLPEKRDEGWLKLFYNTFFEEGQIAITRAEPHLSFTFEHNIVYFDQGRLLGYNGWKGGAKVEMHDNLYWRAGGKPFDFDGKSFAQWQASGRDKDFIIADPNCRSQVRRSAATGLSNSG